MSLQIQNIICDSGVSTHYYLCHYRPRSVGQDELSKSLIQFKNGNSIHVNAWIECCAMELENTQLKKDSIIVRALGHSEQVARINTSMDILGRTLAEKFDAQYIPSLLRKNGKTTKMTRLKRNERSEAILDRYSFSGNDSKEILVIDDILTTGATICAIAKAIRKISKSCTIKFLTLATTNSNTLLNESLKKQILFQSERLEGELATVQEDMESYSEANILRHKILQIPFIKNHTHSFFSARAASPILLDHLFVI